MKEIGTKINNMATGVRYGLTVPSMKVNMNMVKSTVKEHFSGAINQLT